MPSIVLVIVCIGISASFTQAQPSNREQLISLSLHCLGNLPDTLHAFRLEAPEKAPYIQQALLQQWLAEHREVWLESEHAPADLVTLTYQIPDIQITYWKVDKNQWKRKVQLLLQYTLSHPNGALLDANLCTPAIQDTIPDPDQVEDPLFPETIGKRPLSRWQKWIEPVLWSASLATTVYLFFTLRSKASR